MPHPDFGSPDRDDATGRWERLAQEAAQRVDGLTEVMGKVANRPFGSKPAPRDVQEMEFLAWVNDPEAVGFQMWAEQNTVKPETMLRYAEAMLKRLGML